MSYHHQHTGSPHAMYQLYQDSMAICRALQKPDIFLTMTANPQWPEIVEALKRTDGPDQKVEDRPDIVAKVFQLKKEALLEEIKKGGIFGKVRAMVAYYWISEAWDSLICIFWFFWILKTRFAHLLMLIQSHVLRFWSCYSTNSLWDCHQMHGSWSMWSSLQEAWWSLFKKLSKRLQWAHWIHQWWISQFGTS